MCHWALRVWECGDSFFTKYSSCSFDRAAHPNNPLNPLHPSITPLTQEEPSTRSRSNYMESPAVGSLCTNGNVRGMIKTKHSNTPKTTTRKQSRGHEPSLSWPTVATIDDGTPKGPRRTPGANGVQTAYAPDGRTGDIISIMPLSEVGNAARFGDQALVESKKCQVFEVVLQQRKTPSAHHAHEALEELPYLHTLADASA